MPAPISSSRSSSIVSAEPTETEAPKSSAPQQSNDVSSWKGFDTNAYVSDTADRVRDTVGWFSTDTGEALHVLGGLDGNQLRRTLNNLQGDGTLDSIAQNLSSSERQQLLDLTISGGLVRRDEGNRKLVPNGELPYALTQLVDDLNKMGPQRTEPTAYNWTAAPDTTG